MPALVPTHINAYYRDLIDAKQAAAVADQRVVELEAQIVAMGGTLPGEEVSTPEAVPEDTVTPEDVSATESQDKPLSKMNRSELNAKATELGVEAPEELETNKAVIEAIKSKEGQK